MGTLNDKARNKERHNANKYFNYTRGHIDADNVFESVTDEAISIFGVDFIYIKIDEFNSNDIDKVYGELKIHKYTNSISLRMYLSDLSLDGDIFSSMGLKTKDEYKVYIGVTRFKEMIGRVPWVGDLVYHPASKKLFKVKRAEDESSIGGFFYINSKKYQYKISIVEYINHEDINMDDIENDEVEEEFDITNFNDLPETPTSNKDEEMEISETVIDDFEKNPFGDY